MDLKDPRTWTPLVGEIRRLARVAPDRLAAQVEGMTVRQQAELALMLPAAERLELMLHAPKPMRLVRAIPDAELYLTLRELGPTDALPLVALASARQLSHVLDLESWRRDRFDANRSGAWVALFLDAGDPALKRFLRSADDDLLALLFQRWIRVAPIEVEEDHGRHGRGMTEAGDELGLVSPDGEYRFIPAIPEHGPAIQKLAQMFFLDQRERYQRTIWAALHELPAELEENSLHWRQSRLEEHGFPPWEEALDVYAPPAGARVRPSVPIPTDPDGLAAARTPLRALEASDLLAQALDRPDSESRERVLHELLSVANRILVADGADTGDPLAHRTALATASGYVRIAIDTRGARDPEGARRVVDDVPMIELFREGYSQAARAQQEARELLDGAAWANHPKILELFDAPLHERLACLLERRPIFHAVPEGPRPFANAEEIDETRAALEMATTLGRVLLERLGFDATRFLDGAGPPELARMSTFLLTAMAWNATRGELRSVPLPPEVTAEFLRNVASRRTAAPDAARRALDGLIARLAENQGLSPREVMLIGAFGRAALERLGAECGTLDPGVPPDPRAVSCLLLDETGSRP